MFEDHEVVKCFECYISINHVLKADILLYQSMQRLTNLDLLSFSAKRPTVCCLQEIRKQ